MKLAITTQDLCNYAPTVAEGIRLFKDTGFKCLDFNFYRMNAPDCAFRGNDWMREIEKATIAAEVS